MLLVRYIFIFFCPLFFLPFLWSETRAACLADHHLKELTLKNGMRVCLKQSEREPGEVEFQLFALGGFASLNPHDRPSAWLAPETAWESGIAHQTSDELACTLDDRAIEMGIKIKLFDRQIEVTTPSSELAYSLGLVRLFFIEPQFKIEGMKAALTRARSKLQKRAQAGDLTGREIFWKVNMQNWDVLAPFTFADLSEVKVEKTNSLFKKFFSNPSDFVLVMVGDFNPQLVIPLLETTLGSLPAGAVQQWTPPQPPAFPDGIIKKEFSGITRYKKSVTRLTFPLSPTTDLATLDLLIAVLKQRFLSSPSDPKSLSKNLNICYEFPLFPLLDVTWLIIQFSSPPSHISSHCQFILKTLAAVKQKGLTEQEVASACQELERNQLVIADNATELLLLANTYRIGADIEQIYSSAYKEKSNKELIKKVLECYPKLDQYSIITLQP
jgi:predicted Zn-dependent peptidase